MLLVLVVLAVVGPVSVCYCLGGQAKVLVPACMGQVAPVHNTAVSAVLRELVTSNQRSRMIARCHVPDLECSNTARGNSQSQAPQSSGHRMRGGRQRG